MTSEPASTNNSYLFDPESAPEMARLINMDHLTTKAMGGPLAEQPKSKIAAMSQILDIACGPGGWVLDTAFEHPDIEVAGIDISQTMIGYANARARSQGLRNASFEVIDATQPLPFSDQSFDLINGRFLVGFLPRTAWPKLIAECSRILRPSGVLRLTETDIFGITTSPACERLNGLFMQAAHQSGYGFSADGRTFGMTPMLEPLLRQGGFKDIQCRAHALSFPADTPNWSNWRKNAEVAFLQIGAYLVQLGHLSQEEADRLCQQVSVEMLQPEFAGTFLFLTAWGTKCDARQ